VSDLNVPEGYMSDQIFQDAYTRVRGRHDDQAWFALSPREITDSIYREMRTIDRERLSIAQADFSMAVAAE
jgi:hypothetical protein